VSRLAAPPPPWVPCAPRVQSLYLRLLFIEHIRNEISKASATDPIADLVRGLQLDSQQRQRLYQRVAQRIAYYQHRNAQARR